MILIKINGRFFFRNLRKAKKYPEGGPVKPRHYVKIRFLYLVEIIVPKEWTIYDTFLNLIFIFGLKFLHKKIIFFSQIVIFHTKLNFYLKLTKNFFKFLNVFRSELKHLECGHYLRPGGAQSAMRPFNDLLLKIFNSFRRTSCYYLGARRLSYLQHRNSQVADNWSRFG